MSTTSDSDTSLVDTERMQHKSTGKTNILHRKGKQNVKLGNKKCLSDKVSKSTQQSSSDTSDDSSILEKTKSNISDLEKIKQGILSSHLQHYNIKTEQNSDTLDSESDSTVSSDEGKSSQKKSTTQSKSNEIVTNSEHNLKHKIGNKVDTNRTQSQQTKKSSKEIESNESDTDAENEFPSNQELFKKMNTPKRRKSTESEASFTNVMSSTRIMKREKLTQESEGERKQKRNVFESKSMPKGKIGEILENVIDTSKIKRERISSSSSETEDETVIENKKFIAKQELTENINISQAVSDSGNNSKKNVKRTVRNMKEGSESSEDSDCDRYANRKIKRGSHLKKTKAKSNISSNTSNKYETSDSETEPVPKQNSFISQKKLGSDNFAQNILKRTKESKCTTDESVSETQESAASKKVAQRRRQSVAASENENGLSSLKETLNIQMKENLSKLVHSRNDSIEVDDILKKFVDFSPSEKVINVDTNLHLDEISEDDEIWVMQCPKDLNPALLVGQKLKLERDSIHKLKLGSNKYECISRESQPSSICLVASESSTNNNLALKIIQPAGSIVIHQVLKDESPIDVQSPNKDKIEPPSDLKVRHPIFGSDFEEKLKLNESIESKLREAELNSTKIVKMKKKKVKKTKIKQELSPERGEMIFELLREKKDDMKTEAKSDEDTQIKKKKKKRKLSGDDSESCRKTVLEPILKSYEPELNLPMKQPKTEIISDVEVSPPKHKKRKMKQEGNMMDNVQVSENEANSSKHKKHKKMKQDDDTVKVKIEDSDMLEGSTKKSKKKEREIIEFPDYTTQEKNKSKKHKKSVKTEENLNELLDTDTQGSKQPDLGVESSRKHKKHKSKDGILSPENIKKEIVEIEDIKRPIEEILQDEIRPKKKHKKSKKTEISVEDSVPSDSQVSIFSDSKKDLLDLKEEVPKKHKKHKKKSKSENGMLNLENIKKETLEDEVIKDHVKAADDSQPDKISRKKKHKKNKHREDHGAMDMLLEAISGKQKKIKSEY